MFAVRNTLELPIELPYLCIKLRSMKYLLLIALPLTLLISQSCTVQEGVRKNRGVAAMDYPQNHVRKAEGSAKKTRLGKPNARIKTKNDAAARRDLMENYPLGDNQAYANMRIDSESTGYILFRTHRAFATADIVEISREAED